MPYYDPKSMGEDGKTAIRDSDQLQISNPKSLISNAIAFHYA
jgi:hypothetical protein